MSSILAYSESLSSSSYSTASLYLPLIASGVVGGVLAVQAWRALGHRERRALMRERVRRKRQERDTKREAWAQWAREHLHESISREEQEMLSHLSAADITKKIKSGELTAERVVSALSLSVHKCAEQFNCVSEEMFDSALEAAKQKDEQKKQGRSGTGLLEGVPISVKDQAIVAGTDATMGMACRALEPAEEDGLLVRLLKDEGAIPLSKGTAPQLLLTAETASHLWGVSSLPWDLSRTCGGSSGGDAAVVAGGGVPLAIGTDIGGSIRIPASFCGVVGFKPTPLRVTSKGLAAPSREGTGQKLILPTAGPIARTVDDCVLAMRVLISSTAHREDSTIPPLAFDQQEISSTRKLRIAYHYDDGWFPASKTSVRAVKETVKAAESLGHEVVHVPSLVDGWEVARCYYGIMAADGGKGLMEALEGEEVIPQYKLIVASANLPSVVRWALTHLFSLFGKVRLSWLLSHTSAKSAYSLLNYNRHRVNLKQKFLDRLDELNVDAVICPAYPLPAPKHRAFEVLTPSLTYLMAFNLFDLPAGVIPVTVVKEDECTYECQYQDKLTAEANRAMEGAAGLPVAAQIVTRPWRDELCLRLMRELEGVIGFSKKHPRSSLALKA